MPSRKRPGVFAVLQDSRGNAFGKFSIRGKNRGKFNDKQGSHQRKTLDKIPEEDRGPGHGSCAEQSILHEVLFILQCQERNKVEEERKIFVEECKIVAYRRGCGDGKRYRSPIPPCSTCKYTNEVYGFEDKAGETSQSTASESGSQEVN